MHTVAPSANTRPGQPVLQCFHVCKCYADGRNVLKDLCLEVRAGEFTVLFGPGGAGKSVLLRLLLALEPVSEGHILIDGENMQHAAPRELPRLRRRIGALIEGARVIDNRTAFENVALPLEASGKDRLIIQHKTLKALKWAGLEAAAETTCSFLSTAEKRRVALARAVVNNPLIVLADEPTAGLDDEAARHLLSLIEETNGRGAAIVIATSSASLLKSLSGRRVIEINHGQIATMGGAAPAAIL